MNRKILGVLAPLAAVVGLMAVPSLAQAATTQAQCGGVECITNQVFIGQAGQLKWVVQEPAGEIHCPAGGTLEGTVTSPQGDHVTGSITKFIPPQSCTHNGVSTHVFTNASAAEPWTLQIQQPEATGAFIAHIIPAAGHLLQFTDQIQVFGGSVATCHWSSESVQLTGSSQNDALTIDKTKAQFALEARQGFAAAECGSVGTTIVHLEGSIQLETSSGAAVVVHQS